MGVKLVNNIPKIKAALKAQVAKGLNNAAQHWVGEAKDLAPVLTGELKAGIGQTTTATPESLSAEVRSLANHSTVVNFGSSRQAPQPFWTISALLTKQKFPQFIFGKLGSAGSGVVRAARDEFHGPLGRQGRSR